MRYSEWIKSVIESGNLCGAYQDKTMNAKSKLDLVRICLDANGASYLCEMQAKGIPLPYETICKEFKSYINGRYVAEFKNERDNGYDSCIYCCYSDSDSIEINTTLTTILGCKLKAHIREYDFVHLYIDKGCEIELHCPKTARCMIDYWDGAKIDVYNPQESGKVELIKH